ncbi:penicillin-binding protein 2 [Thalassobius sp. Cn5-15]|uniref:penicillin-binding protein 2 n=1 Tax=Thalassobius sp. Cn5-15 TaxID=2917763 RepID=UPI001EF3B9CF|nr:penicillin-binding protein 2 [Thalassobius sp. Cn5-15]MCG7493664.1 penicillin-binding protein 2 [Thalassobius sp. Cn5-15]
MKRTPRDTADSARRITRRALLLGGAQVAFGGMLALRMRYMQVDQADEFRLLAEENRVKVRLIPPARGALYDRNGAVIAKNEPSYRIIITPEDAGDVDMVIRRLSHLIDLDPEDLAKARKEIHKHRGSPFRPVTLADRVSWEAISRVAVNAPALPGITPEVGLSRNYPLGPDLAHVAGYVGPVSDYDLSKIDAPDQLLLIPRFQIGKVGVEAKLEENLRGKAGNKQVEVNSAGREMRELNRREGQPGANLQLTIDHRLQNYAQARLGRDSAAAVVVDCDTGDILCAASAPSFDPNLFVRGISVRDYRELTENKYRPLANKAVQGLYPPGSTFKMVTILAALEAGEVTPDETVYCPGHMEVANRRFHCWKRAGHGQVDLITSLRESCDVYFYELALRVGIEKISAMAEKLGLGQRYDLPMSAIARGRAPTKEWKQSSFGQDWVVGDTVNASIGQGFVLASPLQLAVMTARMASGNYVAPRLIKSVDGVEQVVEASTPLDINPNHLRMVRRAMYAVSNHRKGTAYKSRIIADDMQLAGKTGTSQVRNITAEERRRGVTRNEDLPWERRDHALFVNFAPYNNPKYAVAVVVEHGGGGSTVAAPIARDITLQALYNGDPPLEAYPKAARSKAKAQQDRLRRERRAFLNREDRA